MYHNLPKKPDVDKLCSFDSHLRPYLSEVYARYERFQGALQLIEREEKVNITEFSSAYKKFGIHRLEDNSILWREWAPGAAQLWVRGEFNKWTQGQYSFKNIGYGKWELKIPAGPDGSCVIPHKSKLKLTVWTHNNHGEDRISPWATYVVQQPKEMGCSYDHVFWDPPQPYVFKHSHPQRPDRLRIYESHVGISSPEPKIASYREFADNVIHRAFSLGYNAIELMAIMEHAYYASFGYQVTNFFAASSRFGPPDDLKYLVDCAHSRGMIVLLDVVHSHASKNVMDGLNKFDGTDGCFFHDNARGFHNLWDSRLFDYTQREVLRFLLSNLRWWVEEYHIDGFRFDGVMSMIYHHHGLNHNFSGSYDEYFGMSVDVESLTYLTLANYMLHKEYPFMITIAEEVSGMPALCRPINEGGQGFDYRMAMAIPDLWIKLLKKVSDEDWDIGNIVHNLTNRRYMEATIAYAECHDQALVGDKTIAFWLMDKEMYTHMSIVTPLTGVIDRGLSLHKLIRFITHVLGGEGYMNFMGNEFGHPEWLDFPRVGNKESYYYARRQYNLVEDHLLRYKFLYTFDRALNQTEQKYGWLKAANAYVSTKHQDDKVIVCERADVLFVFNLHTHKSFTDYKIGVNKPGKYKIVLDSDHKDFGGHGRIDPITEFHTFPEPYANRQNHLFVYIPCRTGLALALADS